MNIQMSKSLVSLALSLLSLSASSQGDNAVLFSTCGDTVLTRTSCYCKTKDTLWSYFTVLENINGSMRLLSVFPVQEPNKNSIPCADFNLVHPDTLAKYQLYNVGFTGNKPENFNIVSKVQQLKKTKNNKGEKVYVRLIRHEFQLDKETFFTTTLFDIVKKKKAAIKAPKIKKIFAYHPLNKYFFEIITENYLLDADTGKVQTIISHEKIGN